MRSLVAFHSHDIVASLSISPATTDKRKRGNMKAGKSVLGRGGLAILVALTGIFVSALPGHLRTGGLVVRADCILTGKATFVNGIPTCDCTIGAQECGCIIKSPCPVAGLLE